MTPPIRRAHPGDVSAIHHLMHTVATATAAGLYVPDDLPFIQRHVADQGFTFLAHSGTELVGFALARFPGTAEDNLGQHLNLSVADLSTVGHIESVAVHAHHRGLGLARALVVACERATPPPVRWLLCTVAPANTHSLATFEHLRYRILTTTTKYGGLTRHVLVKDLEAGGGPGH